LRLGHGGKEAGDQHRRRSREDRRQTQEKRPFPGISGYQHDYITVEWQALSPYANSRRLGIE
jgi:hypothetical protein